MFKFVATVRLCSPSVPTRFESKELLDQPVNAYLSVVWLGMRSPVVRELEIRCVTGQRRLCLSMRNFVQSALSTPGTPWEYPNQSLVSTRTSVLWAPEPESCEHPNQNPVSTQTRTLWVPESPSCEHSNQRPVSIRSSALWAPDPAHCGHPNQRSLHPNQRSLHPHQRSLYPHQRSLHPHQRSLHCSQAQQTRLGAFWAGKSVNTKVSRRRY